MTLTFKDSVAGDFSNAIATTNGFGQTVTITSSNSQVFTPTAIVTPEETHKRETEEGTRLVHTRKLLIAPGLDEAFDAATSSAANMKHTVDGLTYITDNFSRTIGVMTFEISRDATNERTRKNYRRR